MQIFKGKSYSDTRKNFSEKNFGNFLNLDSIYVGVWLLDLHPPLGRGVGPIPPGIEIMPMRYRQHAVSQNTISKYKLQITNNKYNQKQNNYEELKRMDD